VLNCGHGLCTGCWKGTLAVRISGESGNAFETPCPMMVGLTTRKPPQIFSVTLFFSDTTPCRRLLQPVTKCPQLVPDEIYEKVTPSRGRHANCRPNIHSKFSASLLPTGFCWRRGSVGSAEEDAAEPVHRVHKLLGVLPGPVLQQPAPCRAVRAAPSRVSSLCDAVLCQVCVRISDGTKPAARPSALRAGRGLETASGPFEKRPRCALLALSDEAVPLLLP